jgi:hypothetical protein
VGLEAPAISCLASSRLTNHTRHFPTDSRSIFLHDSLRTIQQTMPFRRCSVSGHFIMTPQLALGHAAWLQWHRLKESASGKD